MYAIIQAEDGNTILDFEMEVVLLIMASIVQK
jgi:hypothetical protein